MFFTTSSQEANAKAVTLLESILTPAQLLQWHTEQRITVTGNVTGRTYILHNFPVANIACKDTTGKHICTYCIVPTMHLPLADQLTAQVLMLTANENYFLHTANEIHFSEAGCLQRTALG